MKRLTLALLVLSLSGLSLSGCVSAQVQRGAAYGAGAGAVLGAGSGWVLSDPALLGSKAGGPGGDTQLSTAESIASGAAIGLVVGSIVGAMVGHQRDDGYVERPRQGVPATPAPTPSGAAAADGGQATLRPIPRL